MSQQANYATQMQEEGSPDIKFKFNIGAEELREIVMMLNRKPFEMNFTLVSFDEQNPNDALELVNSIFAKLDKKHDVKIKEEGAEKTLERFVEFLRILDYPGKFDEEVVKKFMNGDKKVLNPIFYFCLANFDHLIKRAYLGKFLVPIQVPPEYMADEEMKKSNADYMNLIEEFKENHKVFEEKKKNANPTDLKKEITQLEHEKELLSTKIKEFKQKYEDKADFQAIFKEITLMRKEQEEEGNLMEKLRNQKRLLHKCDEDLLVVRQKHFEAKKSLGEEANPDEMLFALRQEVGRSKIKISEIQFELKEKRKKIAENEVKLYEPLPPADQIEGMKNKVSALRNIVVDLTRRLEQNKDPEKEDKLFIQKQQEQKVRLKKEKVEADMKKFEEEKNAIEERIREKTKELVVAFYAGKTQGSGLREEDRDRQVPGQVQREEEQADEDGNRAQRAQSREHHPQRNTRGPPREQDTVRQTGQAVRETVRSRRPLQDDHRHQRAHRNQRADRCHQGQVAA